MKLKKFATAVLVQLLALQAQANFTYEGSLVDPSGAAVSSGSVLFQLEIVNSAASCVLYKETHNIAMTNPDGYFSLVVGTGTGSNTNTVGDVFQSGSPLNCDGGGTYTPTLAEGRKLRVSININNTTMELLGTVAITAVPTAMVAHSANVAKVANNLGNFQPQHLLRAVDGSGNPVAAPGFDPTQLAELVSLVNGSSTHYQTKATNGAGQAPAHATTPTTPVAGNFWYDTTSNVLKYYNGSSTVALMPGLTSADLLALPANSLVVGGSQLVTLGNNVGIGTNAPTLPLHVVTSSGSEVALFKSGTTPISKIALSNNSGDTPVRVGSNQNAFTVSTGSGGTVMERMRVMANGYVGIGFINPISTLHVNGPIQPGFDATSCITDKGGAIQFNTTMFRLEYCDPLMLAWIPLATVPTSPEASLSGNSVDFNISSTVVLTGISGSGSATIGLQNMQPTKHYRVIIEDTVARTHIFTGGGCTSIYYSPNNGATLAGYPSIYDFYRTNGGKCYVTWKTYQ